MELQPVIDILQPYYSRVLSRVPESVARNVQFVFGEQLDATSLAIAAALVVLTFSVFSIVLSKPKKRLPPSIPGGYPLLGNILQLSEAKPHRTFTNWSHKYGPIFHLKTGAIDNVVITSAEIAKEVMVTKYSSVSSRRMTTALDILTQKKTMVAMSDYGDEHRMLKKLLVNNLLGPTTQKANRPIRENALKMMLDELFATVNGKTVEVDVREFIKHALFPFSMQQVFGYVPEGVYVPELGKFVDKWEIFEALVIAPLRSVINVDWRNYFPYLNWMPNKSVEDSIQSVHNKRTWIVEALIAEQRKLLKSRVPTKCYADILITEATHLTPKQLMMSVWEPIIESADTTLVTTEWAMYELARNPEIQDRLYKEIKSVVGDRMATEDDLHKFPLLTAVIQETLRVYPPVPIVPPRYIHEDITLGGYDVPKGWEVLINIYGINRNPNVWSDPEKWDPDRLVNDKEVDLGFKDFRILPFGGGKRMCGGIQQALYIIPMKLVSFILHFEWSLPPVDPNTKGSLVEDTTFLTTHKLHPLRAVARPRVSSRIPF